MDIVTELPETSPPITGVGKSSLSTIELDDPVCDATPDTAVDGRLNRRVNALARKKTKTIFENTLFNRSASYQDSSV